MSFDYNKWEEELRSKVETHEFAFDESAWEEMDTLLDQGGGTIAPKENTPPASAGHFTSWIFGSLIVIAIGLFSWWMFNTTNKKEITLSGFNITTIPEEAPSENQVTFENAPSIKKAGSTYAPKIKTVLPADIPQTRTETTPEEPTTKPITNSTTTKQPTPEPTPLADRSAAYLTPSLDLSTDIPLLPTVLDDPFPEALPVTIKRSRNRRTLYPDVIERY